MAKAGDEPVNPVTRLRTAFRKTARETSGELLQVDWIGGPGWTTGPDHIHPHQEERFEVLSGKLGLRSEGVERVHGSGEVIVAPAGSAYAAWNKDVGARVGQADPKVGEALGAEQQFAHDQQRPALAHEVQGVGGAPVIVCSHGCYTQNSINVNSDTHLFRWFFKPIGWILGLLSYAPTSRSRPDARRRSL